MKQLYYGDNLQVLRNAIATESVDLIYLDPPFNSNRDYNANFNKDASEWDTAQLTAFEDSWTWTDESTAMLDDLRGIQGYENVSRMLDHFVEFLEHNDTAAYLVMMAPRLVEMHRVLKETGSIYLHCDPTASHYLKILMDEIFGKKNFLNEIIWHYRRWPAKSKAFQRFHDVILFYAKQKPEHSFNTLLQDIADITKKIHKGKKQSALVVEGHRWSKDTEELTQGTPLGDAWYISTIAGNARERLGYPTQKPLDLLERIIEASSNPGDVILDPFCGCGTALAAAEKLGRNWIGIDVTPLAINVIEKRLQENFGLKSGKDFEIVGDPNDFAGANKLAHEKDRYHFENWVLRLLNCIPSKYQTVRGKVVPVKGGDGGFDGFSKFHKEKFGDNRGRFVVEVKSGKVGRRDVDIFARAMEREKADLGVFVVLNETDMSKDGYTEAAKMGAFTLPLTGEKIPKLQIWSIEKYFAGQKPILPFAMAGHHVARKVKKTQKKSEQTSLL